MDADVEEWLEWQCADQDDDNDERNGQTTLLRRRTGARWVPTFTDYIDRHVNRFGLSLGDGAVRWWRDEGDGDGIDDVRVLAPAVSGADQLAGHVVVHVGFRSSDGDPTASSVWDGSVMLSRWLLDVSADEAYDVCMELGAGCGLAGLVAAARGVARTVILTDLPAAVPLLERNIALLGRGGARVTSVIAQPLVWGCALDAMPLLVGARVLLLCSDCLLPYSVDAFPLLADTIARVLHGAAPASVCMLSYEERCDVSGFFASLDALRCVWRPVVAHDDCHLIAIHAQRCL